MNIKEMYENNINIMKYFKGNNDENVLDTILLSYDLQSGSYVEGYKNKEIKQWYENGNIIELTSEDYQKLYAKYICKELDEIDFNSILEVGIGEATTLCDIVKTLQKKSKKIYGIEISLSRLLYAKKFVKESDIKIELSVGDMFNLPYSDSSIDIVMTNSCIEPNTNKEKEALLELARVANKYVVLVEPSYEFGDELTRSRIKEHGYIRKLKETAEKLQMNVVKYEKFAVSQTNKITELLVIKVDNSEQNNDFNYSCPVCKSNIEYLKDNEVGHFCNECFSIFPTIKDISLLHKNYAILCSKYKELIEE